VGHGVEPVTEAAGLGSGGVPFLVGLCSRVFGLGDGAPPAEVRGVTVQRDTADTRTATVRWSPSAGATAYVVRFGVAPDKLYTDIQVDDVTTLTTNALNRGVRYYFTVDAISAAGVARGTAVVSH